METRLVSWTEGYCPLYCCPAWCPCQGGQLPHDGKAGRKENQTFSVRQWNMTGYMTSTLDEIGKKNMQCVFIQKIHLKLTQRKTQPDLSQIWRQLNSFKHLQYQKLCRKDWAFLRPSIEGAWTISRDGFKWICSLYADPKHACPGAKRCYIKLKIKLMQISRQQKCCNCAN